MELTVPVAESRSRLILCAGLLLAMVLVAYVPAMRAGFVYDDDRHVLKNDALADIDGLRRIGVGPLAKERHYPLTTHYYPLVFTSFWIEHHIWADDATGYHVVNVLLHALCVILLWLVLRKLAVPGAWLAAAIFAVHPVHVESVAWISERKNVLSGAFYLASVLAYLRFCGIGRATVPDDAAPGRAWFTYGLAAFLFLCALLSKAVTATLPVALLLILWWKRDRLRWRDVAPLVPLLVLGVALGLLSIYPGRQGVGAAGPDWDLSFTERCLIANRALWFYARTLICPLGLAFVYPCWQVDTSVWWQWVYPLASVVAVVALWMYRRRIGRGPLVAVLFFVVTVFPALGFVNVHRVLFSHVANHVQYLASIGLIALFAAVVAQNIGPAGVPASAILLVSLGALSWHESQSYADEETLWRDTLQRNSNAWVAHLNLGAIEEQRDQLDRAIDHYRQALSLKPDDPESLDRLAIALAQTGAYEEAIPLFVKLLEARPEYVAGHNNLGNAYLRVGQIDQAIQHQLEAIRLDPGLAKGHYDLGATLFKANRLDEAEVHFRKAVEIDPGDARTLRTLSSLLLRMDKPVEAFRYLEEAVDLVPDDPKAHLRLAEVGIRAGLIAQAVRHLEQAIQLRPNWPGPTNNLAWIYATHEGPGLPNPKRAVELAERARTLSGAERPYILDTLAAAYAAAGRFDEAIKTAQRAIDLATKQDLDEMAEGVRKHLEAYKAKRPWRVQATQPGAKPISTTQTTKPTTTRSKPPGRNASP